MNIVDLGIIAIAFAVAIQGARFGFVRGTLAAAGLTLGLLLASLGGSQILAFSDQSEIRTLVFLLFLLCFVLAGLHTGLLLGSWLHEKTDRWRQTKVADQALGSLVAVVAAIIALWLGASMFDKSPSVALNNQIDRSWILSSLDRHVLLKPHLVVQISNLLRPLSQPSLFIKGTEPVIASTAHSQADLGKAAATATPSVVRVEGVACDAVSIGSGFFTAKDTVVTNAHVLAGVSDPHIIDTKGNTWQAKPIFFDAEQDLAVLHIPAAIGNPLDFRPLNTTARGTDAVVLGFPGGNFAASSAIVTRRITAMGYDIYDRELVQRKVFVLNADIQPGNSGGPLVDAKSNIIGIIVGHSSLNPSTGYAIAPDDLAVRLSRLSAASPVVSTGPCR